MTCRDDQKNGCFLRRILIIYQITMELKKAYIDLTAKQGCLLRININLVMIVESIIALHLKYI